MDFRYLFDENAEIRPKVRKTAELFASHLSEVTKSPGDWASFLGSAAKMYKYSFVDQMLIHAQRPGAAACAAIDFWNERMGRWVKRGSKGIALIDRTNPKKTIAQICVRCPGYRTVTLQSGRAVYLANGARARPARQENARNLIRFRRP